MIAFIVRSVRELVFSKLLYRIVYIVIINIWEINFISYVHWFGLSNLSALISHKNFIEFSMLI